MVEDNNASAEGGRDTTTSEGYGGLTMAHGGEFCG